MESSLKYLLDNKTNSSKIPGLNTKEKKQSQMQIKQNLEDCTKNLFSLPSSVLSENFGEKIKKEKFQKFANSETNQKNKKIADKESGSQSNKFKHIVNEGNAENYALKNYNKSKKVDFSLADEEANKLICNEADQIKDLNVSAIELSAEEVCKMNLDSSSLSQLLSLAQHQNSKIKENFIPSKNYNLNLKTNNNLNQIINSNAQAIKIENAQLKLNHEFNTKNEHINQLTVSKPTYENSVENLLLNSERVFSEENLSVVPKPKEMNINSYIERKVDIYSNLYPVKINKNYCLYTYYVDFQGDSEHFNTFLKRKIISKAYLELIPIFGVYFSSGENFYATEKVKEVTNIISTYNKVKYSFLIRPVGDFFEMKDYDANNKNKCLFKNILELIYKDVLKANPDVKMIKNMCGKKCTEKVVTSRDNKVLVIPSFSTKIMLLEAGIFLNVDNKNKILNGDDCLKLIKQKMKNPAKPTASEMRIINEAFIERIIETKHTNQRFKIDSISFDRTPKNTNLNVDGN